MLIFLSRNTMRRKRLNTVRTVCKKNIVMRNWFMRELQDGEIDKEGNL